MTWNANTRAIAEGLDAQASAAVDSTATWTLYGAADRIRCLSFSTSDAINAFDAGIRNAGVYGEAYRVGFNSMDVVAAAIEGGKS